MNNQDALRRKKLYYDGLKRAVAFLSFQDMDEFMQDPDVEEDAKVAVKIWVEVGCPLHNAIVYIYNNRMIAEDMQCLIERDLATVPLMAPGEIFDILATLIAPTVTDFLSVLPTTSMVKEKLMAQVAAGDRDGFVAHVRAAGCDTTRLSVLCQNCLEASPLETAFDDEDLPYLIDIVEGASLAEGDSRHIGMARAARQWQSSTQDLMEHDSDENLERYFKDYRTFVLTLLRNSLYMYWDGCGDLVQNERHLIEQIISNPLVAQLVSRYKEEYEAMKSGGQAPFFLPDDFFRSKCSVDDTEHLYLKPLVEGGGEEVFTAFINYVAEKGYIENDPVVKTLFAYRLSGYCRPEGNLMPVIWHGKNGKSYELIYIIRYLCDRGDYKKMRRFFEGPLWVKEKDSSYAHSADTEFRRKMAEFYPGICEFKK